MDSLTFTGMNPFTGFDDKGFVRQFDSKRRPQWVRGRFSNDASWHWYDMQLCGIQIEYPDVMSPYAGPKVGMDVRMPSKNLRLPRVTNKALVGTELFCGSGRIAQSCEQNGMRMNRLDWLLDAGPNTWSDDFGDLRDCDLKALFGVDFIHASPDCRTYSQLTASINQRTMETNFLGKTAEAYHANAILLKLFRCLQLALRDNPRLIFTIENPEATFDLHPLVQQMCKPRKEDGLGASVVRFSFCAFGERVQKNTVLITNSPTLIAQMADDKFRCSRKVQCDFSKRPHEGVSKRNAVVGTKRKRRIVTGHDTKDVTAFPLLFADFLSNSVLQDIQPSHCEHPQCKFTRFHAGACSDMHVCKACK